MCLRWRPNVQESRSWRAGRLRPDWVHLQGGRTSMFSSARPRRGLKTVCGGSIKIVSTTHHLGICRCCRRGCHRAVAPLWLPGVVGGGWIKKLSLRIIFGPRSGRQVQGIIIMLCATAVPHAFLKDRKTHRISSSSSSNPWSTMDAAAISYHAAGVCGVR